MLLSSCRRAVAMSSSPPSPSERRRLAVVFRQPPQEGDQPADGAPAQLAGDRRRVQLARSAVRREETPDLVGCAAPRQLEAREGEVGDGGADEQAGVGQRGGG